MQALVTTNSHNKQYQTMPLLALPLLFTALTALAAGGAITYTLLSTRTPSLSSITRKRAARNSECRWLELKQIDYVDACGVSRVWEMCERKGHTKAVDGVMIVARVVGGKYDDCVLFVRQFRPAVGRMTLELPAGLVDGDETYVDAALRELKEETGWTAIKADVVSVSQSELYLDPGMSNSAICLVRVVLDGTHPANSECRQELEEGEHVDVLYCKRPTREKIEVLAKDLALDANVFFCLFS